MYPLRDTWHGYTMGPPRHAQMGQRRHMNTQDTGEIMLSLSRHT